MISRSADSTRMDALHAGTVYEQLNRMGRFYVLRAFQEAGVLLGSQERYRSRELKEKMGVIPEYDRLFGVLLIILENAGFIRIEDDSVIALSPVDEWDVPGIIRAASRFRGGSHAVCDACGK
jgi:hypothetical protein